MKAIQLYYPPEWAHCYGCGYLNAHCHSTATAAAAKAQAEGLSLEATPLRFVTASLKVDFLKPTPLGPDLRLVGRPQEVKGRKVVVETELYAAGTLTVRGEAVLVQIAEGFGGGAG